MAVMQGYLLLRRLKRDQSTYKCSLYGIAGCPLLGGGLNYGNTDILQVSAVGEWGSIVIE